MRDRNQTQARGRRLVVVLSVLAIVAGATGCDDGEGPGHEAGHVTVTYDGASVEVDLSELSAFDLDDGEGEVYVRLDTVVGAADLGVPLSSLELDFVASDGFRPRDSDNCTDDLVPVPGSSLLRGYIHRQTRDLVWDDELDYPGCLALSDTAEILASEAVDDREPGVIEVVYDGRSAEVDLATLEAVESDGVERYPLVDIVEAADLGVPIADLVFDFVASDGFRPGASANCSSLVPVAGETLSGGYILPGSRNLSWDDALGLPTCMFVHEVVTIEAADPGAAGRTVEVVYGEASETVDLSTLTTVDVDGVQLVVLADVVAAASLGVATGDLVFDFVASDGFRPSDSGSCAAFVPVAGADLSSGYIDPTTGDLSWDASLSFPGCLGVDDVVTIEATAPGRTIEVVYGDASETVDLSTLTTVDVDGVQLVVLADVVAAASLGVATGDLVFDFVASDGFRPSDSGSCAAFVPVAGADLSSGYIDPTTGDLSWDASLSFPGCLGVDDVVTIEATDA